MMSGVYILKTLDGYRVVYSKEKDCLFGSFNDDTMNYEIKTDILDSMFGNCCSIDNARDAIESAKCISNTMKETDDGIMILDSYGKYTFEELLSGQTQKNS
jgi:hypothetical protein